MAFWSDNWAGACPQVMDALNAANADAPHPAYGDDALTERAVALLREVFETDALEMLPVANGTASNGLALSLLTGSHQAVLCQRDAHIHTDELTAPELLTGGARLMPIDGADGKLDAAGLADRLAAWPDHGVHVVQPGSLAITQSTELGTVYSAAEVAAIGAVCAGRGLGLFMDGARFANALVSTGDSPAALTWKAGVKALTFGTTKNGALSAEALILFDPALRGEAHPKRKRAAQLLSKQWMLSAQLLGYLENDVWLDNARHANAMAAELARGLNGLAGCVPAVTPAANELFYRLPDALVRAWAAEDIGGYEWTALGPGVYRLVTGWATDAHTVARAVAIARAALGPGKADMG